MFRTAPQSKDMESIVGSVVSIVSVCVPAALPLPAASVAVTDTAFVPLTSRASVPEVGVSLPVSTLQVPSVAVVE